MTEFEYQEKLTECLAYKKWQVVNDAVDMLNIKIKYETEGFEEATEQVKALVEAYDGFPTQVQIKGCHDCTINIYPSQTKFYEQTERSSE